MKNIIILSLFITLSCNKRQEIRIAYSDNKKFSKKTYYNSNKMIDSIDFYHLNNIYIRHIVKDNLNHAFSYEIDSIEDIDEVPIIKVKEFLHYYQVNVYFNITSQVIWKYIFDKGVIIKSNGADYQKNYRFFDIDKTSTSFKFSVANKSKVFHYNI
jgi:hypothetical protein